MKKVGTARIGVAVGVLAALWAAAGCGSGPSKPKASGPAVVPAPLRLEARPGAFALGPETRIVIVESQVEARARGDLLSGTCSRRPTGYDLGIEVSTGSAGQRRPSGAGAIHLRLSDLEGRLGQEGYLLDVGADRILLRGRGAGRALLRRPDAPPAAAGGRSRSRRRSGPVDGPCRVHRGPAPVRLAGRHARLLPALLSQGLRQALDRHPGHAQAERLPLAPDRRSGLADRDQEVPAPDRGRGLAGRPGGQALERPGPPEARRGRDLRRFLYAGGHPRDRRLRRLSLHHRRARDRDAGARQGGPGRLPRALLHRRAVHGPARRLLAHHRRLLSRQRRHVRRSWRMCCPRSSRSSPARSCTSAATRSTRPNGRAAPSAWPG